MKKTLTTLCLLAAGSTAVLAQDVDFSVAKALPSYDLPCCSQQQYTPDFGEPADFLEMLTGAKKKNKDNKKGAPTPQQQQQAMAGMRPGGAGIPAAPAYNDKNAMLKTFNKDGKWYFEINDTILGRDILAVSRFISTPPGGGLYGGEQSRSAQTVYFEKNATNKTILLRSKNQYMWADPLDDIAKAVKASNTDPILGIFKIEGESDGKYLVPINDFLLSDNLLSLPQDKKSQFGVVMFNPSLSYIESIHTYPENVEVRSVRTFNAQGGGTAKTFGLNTSFYLLPKEPMQQRIFDPRVGYFNDGYFKYSDNQQEVEKNIFVCRRRLEPKNEEDAARQRNGELIEPKKQIVYYIDPATPKQWRPYLIEGVKDWNVAFEQAGWKNAITAKEWPENDSTMSLEDSRYSVIMYLASDIPNAYGPQNHDPRSGEIIECHVGWYHNVMSLVHNWYQVQCSALDPAARNAKFSEELMGELIRFVSSHEVGHTLGLRHNFGASATVPVDKLRDNAYLTENGFCPSIMDYARFNYVAQPEDGVEIKNLFPRINVYDKWAIEWGYKPIYEATDAESDRHILSKITTQKNDADVRTIWYDGENRINDPRFQTEDLGDDAVKAGTLGIENLKRIIPHLREWNYWGGDNSDQRTAEMYSQVMTQFARYCTHAIRNLMGVTYMPKSPDQQGTVFALPPVEKAKAVIPFIEKQVFEEPTWLIDVPYAERIQADMSKVLDNIILQCVTPLVNSNVFGNLNPKYNVNEYFDDLTKAVFKDLNTSKALTRYQRVLQSHVINCLCYYYNENCDKMANEVLGAVYNTLEKLQKKFESAGNSDKTTQTHYTMLGRQIKQALIIK